MDLILKRLFRFFTLTLLTAADKVATRHFFGCLQLFQMIKFVLVSILTFFCAQSQMFCCNSTVLRSFAIFPPTIFPGAETEKLRDDDYFLCVEKRGEASECGIIIHRHRLFLAPSSDSLPVFFCVHPFFPTSSPTPERIFPDNFFFTSPRKMWEVNEPPPLWNGSQIDEGREKRLCCNLITTKTTMASIWQKKSSRPCLGGRKGGKGILFSGCFCRKLHLLLLFFFPLHSKPLSIYLPPLMQILFSPPLLYLSPIKSAPEKKEIHIPRQRGPKKEGRGKERNKFSLAPLFFRQKAFLEKWNLGNWKEEEEGKRDSDATIFAASIFSAILRLLSWEMGVGSPSMLFAAVVYVCTGGGGSKAEEKPKRKRVREVKENSRFPPCREGWNSRKNKTVLRIHWHDFSFF